MKKAPLIVILGPTAMGKTKVAALVAAQIGGEIISADSRQVYRKMNIGTGKDYDDYLVENQPIPHHLIDICEPGEKYNVAQFQQDFQIASQDIIQRGKKAILCGGTGLYIQAILEDFQLTSIPSNETLKESLNRQSKEQLLERLESYSFPYNFQPDISSKKRLIRAIEIGEYLKSNPPKQGPPNNIEYILFGISAEREIRRQRITERLKHRIENGLIEEVEQLLNNGNTPEQLQYYGLEYKFVIDHLEGILTKSELFEKLNVAIHQFAKRQMTWFRKMAREGYPINWINAELPLENKARAIVDKCCG